MAVCISSVGVAAIRVRKDEREVRAGVWPCPESWTLARGIQSEEKGVRRGTSCIQMGLGSFRASRIGKS